MSNNEKKKNEELESSAKQETNAEKKETRPKEKEIDLKKKEDKPKEKEADSKKKVVPKDKKADAKKNEVKEKKRAAKKSRRSLKARAFRRGWFSILLVVIFIAAVVIVNMIAATLVEKVPALNIDTTGEERFSLTDDTLDFLSSLDREMTIYVLSSESDYLAGGDYFIQANTLFQAYANASDKINLEYIDLSSNPTFASNYPDEDLAAYNLIIQSGNDYEYIVESDMFEFDDEYLYYYNEYVITGSNVEEKITSAILNLTLDEKPKVTFITDITEEDYSAFKELLENNGFETDEVSPATGTVSEDTSVVVLFAPTVDLDSDFVDGLSDFLLNDGEYGKQLLYFPSYKLIPMPNIDSLLEEWGLAVELGYALENDTNYMAPYGGYYYLFASQYANTTYTQNMSNTNLPFCFIEPIARAVSILDTSSASALLTTTEQGQVMYSAETDDTASSTALEDTPNGAVAAIATKSLTTEDDNTSDTETKESNIIVIGSSIAVDSTILSKSTYGNASYMLSLLNTVTGRGDVGITVETKTLDGEELGITTAQINAINVVFVIIVPLLILIVGIVIFVKRRNL